jgi:hypothetical protein
MHGWFSYFHVFLFSPYLVFLSFCFLVCEALPPLLFLWKIGWVGLFLFTNLYPCPSRGNIGYLEINLPLQKTHNIKIIYKHINYWEYAHMWTMMKTIKNNIRCRTWGASFQFLKASNIQSFVNIVLANNYIFHDVQNIVKHSLVISKWRVEI